MKVDLKKLYLLKEQIQTTKDFEIPVHYFFDNFADFPEFLNMCAQTEDALLDKIIISIGQEVFKKQKVEVQQKLFLSLKEHHFIHGPVIIENHMMSFAYFTDIKLGVFSVHMESKVMYGRMNALNLSKFQMPSGINLN
jgi:hypothetical protein